MKFTAQKHTLDVILGRPPTAGENVQLSLDAFAHLSLQSVREVASITIDDYPMTAWTTEFVRDESGWKISVIYGLKSADEGEREIWNSAVRLAARHLGIKLLRNPDGLQIQQLRLPNNRDSDSALEFVATAVVPVIEEAQRTLRRLGQAPTG